VCEGILALVAPRFRLLWCVSRAIAAVSRTPLGQGSSSLEESPPFTPLVAALCVSVQSIPVCDNPQDGKHLCFHISVRQCVCESVYSVAARIVNIRLVRMLSICYQREREHIFFIFQSFFSFSPHQSLSPRYLMDVSISQRGFHTRSHLPISSDRERL